MADILMPKATAVWLIDNTGLTFDQIADFCGLHPLEVKGIADGDVAVGVIGQDPIANDQLTRDEINKAEKDAGYRMVPKRVKHAELIRTRTKGPRYTPLSRRQERPNAIAWLVRNHPELTDAQISKLVGTTKTTIQAVRERTHWNSSNIKAEDPVGLGLCSQTELDAVVEKAAAKLRKKMEEEGTLPEGEALKAAETYEAPVEEDEVRPSKDMDADSVFANLGGGKVSTDRD